MNVLTNVKFTCRVSSVLNKDVKQYGKQYMFDQNDDTSWSSDEGTPQWIIMTLDEPQTVTGLCLQFQGGFSGQQFTALVYSHSREGEPTYQETFYPEDINSPQRFYFKDASLTKSCSKIKLVFESMSDLFGRIIVYNFQILS
ncbi:nuclear receptor 2C2-associated protein isoform X2 [Drosophila subobscura]|uniref:nuclear receptor 2C2-associated protein isoform X2 n=1 Tax=Drosophila subobscura TaxID=7241 RepID=UPI00155A4463|nr:nuclear receptor 2C2-associated protein isoform X2 [Drosophila subobscura]